jgi:hypothetical protein
MRWRDYNEIWVTEVLEESGRDIVRSAYSGFCMETLKTITKFFSYASRYPGQDSIWEPVSLIKEHSFHFEAKILVNEILKWI